MSVINKVLRELDQRHAMSASAELGAPREVRPVRDPGEPHEWFWRIIAALLLVALAWVGWVVYQMQPRRLATDLGVAAGESARREPPRVTVADRKPAAPLEPAPAAPESTAALESPAGLRLAQVIETPIAVAEPAPQKAALRELKPKALSTAPRVEKLELTPAPVQRAELEFRRGVAFLQQGRVSEAEGRFAVAVGLDPAHEQARQTLAALLIEQRRLEEARRLLQDGLRANPRQQQFAVALARIHLERADYANALEVLNRGRNDTQPSAEYDAVLGSVLSRMGRDRDAVEAYRAALRSAPDKGGTWLGLALSLENLDRRDEASDAYRRALASGTLTADVRQYAEQKIRQLR
jgi:MSHA biogenesis protein MshN